MPDSGLEQEVEEKLGEFSRLAFRVAYSVLRSREDAEEVAQEAVLTAYRKFRSLRNRDRFRSWLVRITWRLALDRRRSDRRRVRREKMVAASDPEPTPEEAASSTELRKHIWRAIDELPEKHRKTLILAAIEGHDMRSVALLLNLPVGTVKSRIHKARKILLEKLKWIANESRNT
jgi:RNA polymerase sigma-70 factor (ECF subfamily)